MLDILLIIIGSLGLIIGTITDFQKREVADYINYFLIFAGLGIRLISSTLNGDWIYLGLGVFWAAAAYGFGYLMYLSGQWGGGDVKMIAGLGALFGTTQFPGLTQDFVQTILPITFDYQVTFMLHFLFNSFFWGAIYSIVWIFILILLNWKPFRKEFVVHIQKEKKQIYFTTGIATILVISTFFVQKEIMVLLGGAVILLLALPFTFILTRSVENTCMIKDMKIKDLTEGEWIVDDVTISKKEKESIRTHIKRINARNLKYKIENDTILEIFSELGFEILAKKRKNKIKNQFQTELLNLEKNLIKEYSMKYLFQFKLNKFFQAKKITAKEIAKVLDSKKEITHEMTQFIYEKYNFSLENKYICGPKDLGITLEAIKQLQKYQKEGLIDAVKVKIGIPFVPAFLIAFVFTYFFGNVIFLLL